MDVRCGRCGIEYELDDTLVSSRGTQVRCTECGHEFQVRPATEAREDHWRVRTANGVELEYDTLHALQLAIRDHRVGRDDLLGRAGGAFRPFGSIPEFESMFPVPGIPPQAVGQPPRTLAGLAGPRAQSTAYGLGGPASLDQDTTHEHPGVGVHKPGGRLPPPPPRDMVRPQTARSPSPLPPVAVHGLAPASPNAGVQEPAVVPEWAVEAPPKPAGVRPEAAFGQPATSVTPVVRSEPPALGSPTDPVTPASVGGARPLAAFESDHSFDQPRTDSARVGEPPRQPLPSLFLQDRERIATEPPVAPPKRRRWGALAAAFLVLGGLGGAVFYAGPSKVEALFSRIRAAADPARIEHLVADGNALLLVGDLESAKERFVQAGALHPGAPAVRLGIAEVEVIHADHAWLKARLADVGDVSRSKRQFQAKLDTAQASVAQLSKQASGPDTAVLRVNFLRLSGDVAGASAIAARLTGASQPGEIYAKAALSAVSAEPDWSRIAESLKVPTEQHHRRSHALRVYALVKAGELSEAEREFALLEKADELHPLIGDLKLFVLRNSGAVAKEVADLTHLSKVVPVVSPAASAQEKSERGKKAASKSKRAARASQAPRKQTARAQPKSDFRVWLQEANHSLATGEINKAGELFGRVLEVQPGNIEAMAGLGDVARLRNQPARAAAHYDAALRRNPNYVPALMSRADQKWAEGDQPGAVALYRRVVSQVGGTGRYGGRASARIAVAEPGSGRTDTASGVEAPALAPETLEPKKPEPAKDTPEIDTTDLPDIDTTDLPDIDTTDLPEFN